MNNESIEIDTRQYGKSYIQVLNANTKLQQENEQLKEKILFYEKTQTFGDYVETTNKVIELQRRINKAIDFIVEEQTKYTTIDIDGNELIDILGGKYDYE